MKHLNREQIRLIATTINTIGMAWIVGGVIAPVLRPDGKISIIMAVMGLVYGIICVAIALKVLGFLSEDRR